MRLTFPLAFAILILLAETSPIMAYTHFGLSGSGSTKNVEYETNTDRSISGSIAIDLGSFFRLGYTRRYAWESKQGYEDGNKDGQYGTFYDTSSQVINGFDLTMMLYHGDVFTPFISGGIALGQYHREYQIGEEAGETDRSFVGPTVGAGLAIAINENFSLKLSRTWMPAVRTRPGSEPERVLDDFTQIGISYRL